MPKLFKLFSRRVQKEAPAHLGIGTILEGRYRLDEEIGRGGMGIVYRARDLAEQCDVAVKLIYLEKANALTRQQFAREAEITLRMQHPHIVRVYAAGTVELAAGESSPYLVMELVQGTSLADLHGLTFARILDLGQQICEALAYAHEQGLVYRDLKPGNVLIERRGFRSFVKLTDFGLARLRGESYSSFESTRAGTLFYLAPELIAGQPADVASDLYALGATLYEMITDRVPFSDFDEEAILAQHLEAPVTPPSQSRADVPPALEAIVLRLLAKDPAGRFTSAGEVRQALEDVSAWLKRNARRGNLPSIPEGSMEQTEETARVRQFLEASRLVMLPNGDKPVALAAAAQLADRFTDGVWWLDFERLENPGLVLEKVVSLFGVFRDANRPLTVSLIEHLREKSLLLLLIHCDRVLPACNQLTETILRTCPDVRIIVTSDKERGAKGLGVP